MSVITPGRNLVLIGLMGAGKTTVGRVLAERLQRPFVDTDEAVEHDARATIAEIFERDGERGFRRWESEVIRRVAALRGQVIAAGGGAVLDPSNVTHLTATGDLVLLDAEPEVLAERIGHTASRPLLAGHAHAASRLADLRSQRAAAYAAAASHSVQTDGRTADDIAEAVLAWARTRPGLLARDELVT